MPKIRYIPCPFKPKSGWCVFRRASNWPNITVLARIDKTTQRRFLSPQVFPYSSSGPPPQYRYAPDDNTGTIAATSYEERFTPQYRKQKYTAIYLRRKTLRWASYIRTYGVHTYICLFLFQHVCNTTVSTPNTKNIVLRFFCQTAAVKRGFINPSLPAEGICFVCLSCFLAPYILHFTLRLQKKWSVWRVAQVATLKFSHFYRSCFTADMLFLTCSWSRIFHLQSGVCGLILPYDTQ